MFQIIDNIGPQDFKNSNGLSNSPDGCHYPFVAGFAIKDNGIQRENGGLEITVGSLLLIIKNVWILGC